jgi:hypothetical protein
MGRLSETTTEVMSPTTPNGTPPTDETPDGPDPTVRDESALIETVGAPDEHVRHSRRKRKTWNHRKARPVWMKVSVVVVIALLLVPTVSFTYSMATLSNLSFAERGAEWMRSNQLGGVLNTVEGWWLSRNKPKEGGEPDREIAIIETNAAGPTTTVKVVAPHLPKPQNVAVPDGVTPVFLEGVWQPVGPLVGGAQAMYTTQVRPDSVHTSILDGLVWMDPKLAIFDLFPGSEEPGGRFDKPSQVPMEQRLDLIAAFNGGFRMDDAKGGFYLNGVTKGALRDGAASFVTYKDGTATVGQWGRDVTMTPEVVGVRQNLDLIIDNGGGAPNPGGVPAASAAPGQLVPGLVDNIDGKWGATFGNKVYAWRSAVCITNDGAIVYGYGDGLSSLSLANLMLRAGCARAMQLDINTVWMTFNFYAPTRFLDPGSVEGTKLLPEQFKGANRYLSNDARDFVAVFARKL